MAAGVGRTALLLLINGSVADWLREPGEARLVTATMPLITAFLEAISLPGSVSVNE